MKTISSGKLFFLKKVFPIVWFGFLIFFVVGAVATGALRQGPAAIMLFIVPAFMAVIGVFILRNFIWDLMDDVQDAGDYLVVRRGSEEETIRLDNIMNVSVSTNMNPPRITLRLAKPGRFGNEVAFSPYRPFSLNPFAKNAIAEDLIVRVDAARRGVRR